MSLFVPVEDVGSEAIDPSLLMVLMTKYFSRVKFVSPTLSELSRMKTMSRAPQCFSQSEKKDKEIAWCDSRYNFLNPFFN